jgi:hypothetical protein
MKGGWVKGENYIVIPELPKEEQEPFNKWLSGQTCPLVEAEGENKFKCAYIGDYRQWKTAWAKGRVAKVWD